MIYIETNYKIEENKRWAEQRPETKGSLWLWSSEKKYSEVTNEIIPVSNDKYGIVMRSLWLLEYLLPHEHNPKMVLILREAIRMIKAGETGWVKIEIVNGQD